MIRRFVAQWNGRGYEKGEAQPFWLSFLRDVFGITEPEKFISFEVPVPHGFIDALLIDTKVLIEQKSSAVNLDDAEIFLQAKRYNDALEFSRKARWIITCNFREFRVFDMDKRYPEREPTKISLAELPEKFHALDFMIDETKTKLRVELELSLKAGEIVGKLYDALHGQYINPDSETSLVSLNKLCVRLVFCLYAESAGIFGKHKIFRDYLAEEKNIRRALLDLFDVLNTPIAERDPYLDDALKKFPFVNGGLFAGSIEIPNFTPQIRELLLDEASSGFNWAGISPTIFGAVFESTLNPSTRRAGGMHYTSLENIHKVIDPLFLDDLREEFSTVKTSTRNRKKNLLAFQNKLAAIKIFDPACGSGNFLTESYLSLRRIENDVLKELLGVQIVFGELDDPIKVSIENFFGIEINDFAVAVAQTALWIAELQMMQETQKIIHRDLDFLPLKSSAHIHEGNALRIDWKAVAPNVNFIIGNPPFVGMKFQDSRQKADLVAVDKRLKPLDYVAGWYFKAADFMRGNETRAAFVSTNSVAQGEQVGTLWNILDTHIDFAHRTFVWDSESADKAHVHCVVIGFSSAPNLKPKKIFDGKKFFVAERINGYLVDAPNIYATKRNAPICAGVQIMVYGSEPREGGFLLLDDDERAKLLNESPALAKYVRRFMSANDFVNDLTRWCLWLKDATPNELRQSKFVVQRLKNCAAFREHSKQKSAYAARLTPALFASERQPTTEYLLIPIVTSENRQYIPIGYMPPEVIVSNACFTISDATRYTFGVLTSSVHMGWMRMVCGRLESRYRYSATIVYNNFPWCTPTDKQREAIEISAQKILDARKNYPAATLADLYDPLTMPTDLRKAHRANDRAVAAAYGFDEILDDEPAIVAALLKLYKNFTT